MRQDSSKSPARSRILFFPPPTINWIYSLFNNCLPLKPDVFHTWNWGSETGGYQMLTTEPRYLCLIDMEVVLFIITWRWEEVSQVRQMCMCGHLSWAVFLLPGSYPLSSYLQGLWYLMELQFLFIECLTLVLWEQNYCNLTEILDWM